jgi:hypothetical protein
MRTSTMLEFIKWMVSSLHYLLNHIFLNSEEITMTDPEHSKFHSDTWLYDYMQQFTKSEQKNASLLGYSSERGDMCTNIALALIT